MTGKIAEQAELSQVKANVAKLFKLGDQQLDKMFSGKPVAVRRGIPRQQADKICAALLKAGVVAKVKADLAAAKPAAASKSQPDVPAPAQADSPSGPEPDAPSPAAPAAAAQAIPAQPQATQEDIDCPRCGHQQPFSTECGLCKMELTLHIQRLRKKEKIRAFRRQAAS